MMEFYHLPNIHDGLKTEPAGRPEAFWCCSLQQILEAHVSMSRCAGNIASLFIKEDAIRKEMQAQIGRENKPDLQYIHKTKRIRDPTAVEKRSASVYIIDQLPKGPIVFSCSWQHKPIDKVSSRKEVKQYHLD